MSRRSTTAWIAGGVVLAGIGIGVAAHAVATSGAPTARASASATSTSGDGPTTPVRASSAPAAVTPAPDPRVSASSTAAPSASTPSAAPVVTVRKVAPAMSYYAFAGTTLTLGGGVSDLVESGGTCTVSVTKGATTVKKSFAAVPGPSSTDCGAMSLTSPEFTGGTWSLTLSYRSTRAAGVSTPTEVVQ